MLKGDLAALVLGGVINALSNGFPQSCGFFVVLQSAMLHVVRDVAPNEILPPTAPRQAFRPINAGV